MTLLLLLLGCPAPASDPCEDKPECDTGADTSPDDTDDSAPPDETDVGDTDEPRDTGIAALYWVGEIETSAGEYVDATFGYGAWGLGVRDWVCWLTGTLPYEGEAAPGCPDCDWAFDLGGIEGSTAVGPHCDDLGLVDGMLDGYIDYSWGFASVYYYDYNGTPLAIESSLLLYDASSSSWFPFAFNYGGRDWVVGDAEHLEFEVPVFSGSGYAYYYYYP